MEWDEAIEQVERKIGKLNEKIEVLEQVREELMEMREEYGRTPHKRKVKYELNEGQGKKFVKNTIRTKVYSVFQRNPEKELRLEDLLGPDDNPGSVRTAIYSLREVGLVQKVGRGAYKHNEMGVTLVEDKYGNLVVSENWTVMDDDDGE